ncbi:hypothetical protein E8P82_03325 [Arthrobacter echini]|uniref:Trm112 family protein n=1 Tax=Arthrobacter echini TaxID=1529066 RepID=A0A4S5E893_9MICC|nr:hypothetical protein [Arthrobacter echini]THJ67877.1 hypothetical protein E8P82_03325 [Arthrobacter echini]
MPTLHDHLLDVLRCPVTGSTLVQDGDVLRSSTPGPDGPLSYRIEDGIPVLLRADATVDRP